jgi:repressor LexA
MEPCLLPTPLFRLSWCHDHWHGSAIPLLGEISAGLPQWGAEQHEGMVYVDVGALRIPSSHRIFALKVRGDSMVGRHILDGDVVILEQGAEPRHGDVVAALIDGQNTLKTLVVERGRAFLKAENPRYPQLIPQGELMIQGVLRMVLREARPGGK